MTDIFVSYSSAGPDDRWATFFSKRLKEIYEKKFGPVQIYTYECQGITDIAPQLELACHSSVLVPILSERYFSRKNCFLEWRKFKVLEIKRQNELQKHRSDFPDLEPKARFIAPVWRGSGEARHYNTEIAKSAFNKGQTKWVDETVFSDRVNDDHLNDDLSVEDWFSDVTGIPVADLSQYCDTQENGFNTNEVIETVLVRLADHLNPVIQAAVKLDWTSSKALPATLNACAGISAFALRLDQFFVGGWGFSLGQGFERDADGDFLKHGIHEVNILAARALKEFLPGIRCREEIKNSILVFARDKEQRRAPFAVKDRKDEVAGFLGVVHGDYSLAQRILNCADRLKTELNIEPFGTRWVLDTKTTSGPSGDEVIFFDFASRLQALMDSAGNPGEPAHEFREALFEQLAYGQNKRQAEATIAAFKQQVAKRRNDARDALCRWIDNEKELFQDLALGDLTFNKNAFLIYKQNGTTRRKTYDDIMRLLLQFRIVATTAEGAEILRLRLSTFGVDSLVTGMRQQFDAAFKRLKGGSLTVDQASLLWSLQSLCTSIIDDLAFHAQNGQLERHRDALFAQWLRLAEEEDSRDILLRADMISWACTILLLARRKYVLPRETMNELWDKAEVIRNDRTELIKSILKAKNGSARNRVAQFHARCSEELQKKHPAIFPRYSERSIFDNMRVFGARISPVAEASQKAPEGSIIVGHLYVDGEGIILRADEGYNTMFMKPFAEISGIGINSVERLIQELGDQDRNFIEVMSDSVITRCIPLGLDSMSPVGLLERTQGVQLELLKIGGGSTEGRGFTDLLALWLGPDHVGQRIVLRICSLEKCNSTEREIHGPFISHWTYVDVTTNMEKLIPASAGSSTEDVRSQ